MNLHGLARDDGLVHACLHHLYNKPMQDFRVHESTHAQSVGISEAPARPGSIRHRHVVLLSTNDSSLPSALSETVCFILAIFTLETRDLTQPSTISTERYSDPHRLTLTTMDSPIVKATVQSTLLGAFSNTLGQLIGCWQSGVSNAHVNSYLTLLTRTVSLQR
jgi:hypothetical protein